MRILLCLLFFAGPLAPASAAQAREIVPTQQSADTRSSSQPLCPEAKTQLEMNQCLAAAYDDADREMNRFYSEVRKKQDAAALANLQEAQRAWIKYRNANCEAEALLYDGGSIVPAIRSGCLERNTRARIDELHRVYDTGTR
jgi:uncharacterized protein YecT (DUF1311 family)